MPFKRIDLVGVLGLISPSWAQGVPITGPYSFRPVSNAWDHTQIKWGILTERPMTQQKLVILNDHCTFCFLCTDDPSTFNQSDILGDYYDCDRSLLQTDAVVSGGWNIIWDMGLL